MKNRPWAELLQLVPTISLALPFIVSGRVDLRQAQSGFVLAAVLAVLVILLLRRVKHPQNPIVLGAAGWFWLGALAFTIPIEGGVHLLESTGAWGLFLGALVAGLVATFFSPYGYVATASDDDAWIRRASLALLVINVGCLVWAWFFRENIRLGGGLPFIVLNVVRRVLTLRAPLSRAAGPQPS